MVGLAFAIAMQTAAVTSPPPGPRMPANRLDCETNSHFQESSQPLGVISYSFVFPFDRDEHGNWPKVRWIMTQRDGRSWIDEGRILRRQGSAWPDFMAEIMVERTGEFVRFRSDPAQRGRITISSLRMTSHAGMIEEDGICRIVPDLPGNEGRAE